MSLSVTSRIAPVQEHAGPRESHTSDAAQDEFAGMLAGAMHAAPRAPQRVPQPEGTSELDRPEGGDEAGDTTDASKETSASESSESRGARRRDDGSDDDTRPAEHRHHDAAARPADATNAIVQSTAALDPELQARLARVISRVRQETGSNVKVAETYRSQARQNALFAQGRETPGPVVTWTRNSKHTQGRAVDLLLDGGSAGPDAYQVLQRIAREEGLRTLGAIDPGHLELPGAARDAGTAASGLSANLGFPISEGESSGVDAARLARAATIEQLSVAQGAGPSGSTRVATVAAVAQVASVARVATVAQVAGIATPGVGRPATAAGGVPADAQFSSGLGVAIDGSNASPATPLQHANDGARLDPSGGQLRLSQELAYGAQSAAQAAAPGATGTAPISVAAQDPSLATALNGSPNTMQNVASDAAAVRNTATSAAARPGSRRTSENDHGIGRDVVGRIGRDASRADQSTAIRNAPRAAQSSASDSANRFGDAGTGSHSSENGKGGRDPRGGYGALAAAVALRDTSVGHTAVHEATAAGAPTAAERAARVMAALQEAPARPLSQLTMSVDAGNGLTDRIQVALRGTSIGTTIDAGDVRGADAMRARADELVRALSKDGLTVDSLRVRAAASTVSVGGTQHSGGSSDSLTHSRSERSAPWEQQHRHGSGDDRREQQRQRRGGQER